ncbi:VENN motif pre-toxin domain-containing protein [Cupriavidus basilensis]|uniref:VENN motif pre-toxin domain-containing protein n=1 Tax=Cupriavidus basilensis TaxID=68895 RepID=UPI0039F73884
MRADVGRNLNVESRQDTDNYHSRESSSGFQASLCVPPICYGTTVSGGVSVSSGNTDSTYNSVREQSGIYAGNGGFQVNVKQNTDLKGAVLASTADAGKNSLTTGTLTTSDIENKAEYSSSSSTIAASFDSGQSLLKNGVNTLAATAAGSAQKAIEGDAAGTTRSAIANGTVTITNAEAQKEKTGKTVDETLASLNRDTDGANQAIDKIFDAKKVKEQQEENKVRAELVQQLAPMVYSKVGDMLVGSSPDTKAAVHALVGGLLAQAAGGSFAAGAAGGAAASLAMEAFGKALLDQPGLSDSDRKALVQLAGLVVGGVAGGAAGGSVADVAAGANIGKVATENNYLNHEQKDALAKDLLKCRGDRACVISTTAKYQQIDEQQHADAKTCADGPSCRSIANDARTGSGFSYADAVALCAGVKSCIDFAAGLGPRDVTDTMIANARRDRVELLAEAARTKDTLVEDLDTVQLSGGSFGSGGGAVAGVTGGGKPSAPSSGRNPNSTRTSEISELFDSNNSRAGIQIGNRSLVEVKNNGKAKIFNGASDVEVKQYFVDLTGALQLPAPRIVPGKGMMYVVDTAKGNFTLRDFAGSSGQTGAVWTIDVPKAAVGMTYNPEIKFIR